MRILIDCDILLDVALQREEFFQDSAGILRWAEDHPGSAAVALHTLANLAYLVRPDVRDFIRELLQFAESAPVTTDQARQALDFPMADFEDALQAAAAISFGALRIVTRNIRDYRGSPVPAVAPAQFLKLVRAK